MSRWGYYIREGLDSIFTHGLMSFATVCIILACLMIMGSFALVSLNVNSIIDYMEDQNQILAFVDESLSEEEARGLADTLEKLDNVTSVSFITREAAMDSFLARLEENSLYDEEVDATVFRHRFVVNLEDIGIMARTQQDLAGVPGIAKVNAHLGIARGLVTVRNVVNTVSAVMIVLLFLVSMFIMANTLRLTSFARRHEVSVVKMMGATDGFIRGPFTVEGLVLGLMGSLLAYLFQWLLYELITIRIAASALAFLEIIPFGSLALPLLGCYVVFGLVVAIFGSRIAIRNYMRI